MAPELRELIDAGAVFYFSHSGGKDSQAMYAILAGQVPAGQIVVVHADLGPVEWQGVADHIRATIKQPLNVVRARRTLLQMVEERGMWPGIKHRQCTSDLKRGPIEKFIRNDMRQRGAVLGVNCMGLRAAESVARSKKSAWKANATLSKAGRQVFDWLPIFDLTTAQVFAAIEAAGESPFWAYADGNERLSCVFCIMGSKNDLRHGAARNPELFQTYQALERKTGHTLFTHNGKPIGLAEYIA